MYAKIFNTMHLSALCHKREDMGIGGAALLNILSHCYLQLSIHSAVIYNWIRKIGNILNKNGQTFRLAENKEAKAPNEMLKTYF